MLPRIRDLVVCQLNAITKPEVARAGTRGGLGAAV